jgi:hypothetical protein
MRADNFFGDLVACTNGVAVIAKEATVTLDPDAVVASNVERPRTALDQNMPGDNEKSKIVDYATAVKLVEVPQMLYVQKIVEIEVDQFIEAPAAHTVHLGIVTDPSPSYSVACSVARPPVDWDLVRNEVEARLLAGGIDYVRLDVVHVETAVTKRTEVIVYRDRS